MRHLSLLLLLLCIARPVTAGDPVPFAASEGLDIALSAATSWAADARLVYLENDEDVDANGKAARWGYLFHSASRDAARGYTVRDGKILEATDLEFDFENPPPLPTEWINSGAARAAAEDKAGRKFCLEEGGRLSTMLLIRGAFYHQKPDLHTWTLVYTSPSAPALWVVVSARDGKVLRTWRG